VQLLFYDSTNRNDFNDDKNGSDREILLLFSSELFVFSHVTVSKKLMTTRIVQETVILPLGLCETWLVTHREEHRLKVFESKMLGFKEAK
jgi:hypothetical protein